MSAIAARSYSWSVGNFTATLTVPVSADRGSLSAAVIEWSPCVPKRLTTAQLEQHRAGRNEALTALARDLGSNVAVVEC